VTEERIQIKRSIDDIVAQGYEQVSRKYRIVARLPEGKTGLEALAEVDPELAKHMLDEVNLEAGRHYMRVHARHTQLSLTWEEFNEFLIKTGKKPAPLEKIKALAIAKGTYDPAWDTKST
jgi:hypothetical protein